MVQLVGEGHGDQSNARDQITDVEEEETSEQRVGGSENSGGFLIAPDCPESRAEVPEGVHCWGPGHGVCVAGVPLVECLKWRLAGNCDSLPAAYRQTGTAAVQAALLL